MFDPAIDNAPTYDQLLNDNMELSVKIMAYANEIVALKAKVEKFTSTNIARDEICSDNFCDYCEFECKMVPSGILCRKFKGSKLSPVA